MTENRTHSERFEQIQKIATERKEKLTNLNADFRYKSKELKEKADELEKMGIPCKDVAKLKSYVKEKEERLAFLLDNLEQSLGIVNKDTASTEESEFDL